MNEGKRWKHRLWSAEGRAQLEKFPLAPWASRRRQDLLELLDRLTPTIDELTAAVEQQAKKLPEVLRLMTHPGVGPLTALAFVLIIGTPGRFRRGKQMGSYIGLIPSEDSSGGRQRLGHISKQGNALLRFLLKRRKPQHGTTRTGDKNTGIWRCVGKKASPRWPWVASWPCGCTGCGGTAARIHSR
jgi:transposase